LSTAKIIHHKNNQTTLARFCTIFNGAAEAFASISFSLLYSANALLYDSKNQACDKVIQAAYHTLFIIASHIISIRFSLPE
jgi:hypothetical protein